MTIKVNTKTLLDVDTEAVKESLQEWGREQEQETTKDFSQALQDAESVGSYADPIKARLIEQGLAGEPVAAYEPPKLYDSWNVNTWLDKELAKPKEPNAAYDLVALAMDIVKAREQAKKDLLNYASTNGALWSLQVVAALETVELIQRHEKALQYLVANEKDNKLQSIPEVE